jgi:hypothetical protein
MPRAIAEPWMRKIGAIVREMAPCRIDDAAAKVISLVPPHVHRECTRLVAARRSAIRAAGRKYVVVDGIIKLKGDAE